MSRYIRVTRGNPGVLGSEGLEALRFSLWVDDKETDHVTAFSGAPGAQNFRTLANEHRGVLEPIPEGKYTSIGPLEWCGGEDDYSTYWSSALGPVVAQIYGERAIMLHLDANRRYSPGSAGCLCPGDLDSLKKVVSWWKNARPQWVECDWGLGTFPKRNSLKKVSHKIKFFQNEGKTLALIDDKEVSILAFQLNYDANGASLRLNGEPLSLAHKINSVQLVVLYEDNGK